MPKVTQPKGRHRASNPQLQAMSQKAARFDLEVEELPGLAGPGGGRLIQAEEQETADLKKHGTAGWLNLTDKK